MQDLQAWLGDADWSSGTLGEYSSRLEENFDSPAQLREAYGGVDGGRRFCEDLGIEDPSHCELFEKWFALRGGTGGGVGGAGAAAGSRIVSPPAMPGKTSLGEAMPNGTATVHIDDMTDLLARIDWSTGVLDQYLDALKEKFDGPAQIESIYSECQPDGTQVLDTRRLFDDLHIENQEHRKLFEAWFAMQGGTAALGQGRGAAPFDPQGRHAIPNGIVEQVRDQIESPSKAAGGGVAKAAVVRAEGTSGRTIDDLLWSTDWVTGVLGHYAKVLEDNFDCPEQVSDAYVSVGGVNRTFDDQQFFDDVGIKDAEHRKLFSAWFAKEHDATPKSPR